MKTFLISVKKHKTNIPFWLHELFKNKVNDLDIFVPFKKNNNKKLNFQPSILTITPHRLQLANIMSFKRFIQIYFLRQKKKTKTFLLSFYSSSRVKPKENFCKIFTAYLFSKLWSNPKSEIQILYTVFRIELHMV